MSARVYFSEQNAWRFIASCIFQNRRIDYGICREVYLLYQAGCIPRQRRIKMLQRIEEHEKVAKLLKEQWPRPGRQWKDRAMFCYMLAEEAADRPLQRTRARR